MKYIKIIAVLSTVFLWACTNNSSAQESAHKRVEVSEFEELLKKENIQLVDVRTPQEYTAGHISDATLIDYTEDNFRDQILTLDKSKPVLVYCQAGGRSLKASKIMEKAGFSEIYELQTGFGGWSNAGKPIEK